MDDSAPLMDDEERDAFLGAGGTGVISFASGVEEAPHSVPVSYGYDAVEGTFYFRLAVGPDSEKAALTGNPVTFVAHGRDDEGEWRSVVAQGRLREVTEPAIATETLEGLRRIHIPLVDIFDAPPGEVEFEFYRLTPERLTARRE